jgi:hypothetical protein
MLNKPVLFHDCGAEENAHIVESTNNKEWFWPVVIIAVVAGVCSVLIMVGFLEWSRH